MQRRLIKGFASAAPNSSKIGAYLTKVCENRKEFLSIVLSAAWAAGSIICFDELDRAVKVCYRLQNHI